MQTHLEPEAPNTINFVKYLVFELLKREPLKHGKTIIIRVNEGSPYFPEFTDTLLEGIPYLNPDESVEEKRVFALTKLTAIYQYLLEKFKFHSTVLWPIGNNSFPLALNIPIVVSDPQGLYNMAESLGLSTGKEVGDVNKNNNKEAKFTENIPALVFANFELPIKFGSMQFCLCKIAFGRKINEPISWDEVAEEIEGHKKDDLKSDWKRIYYVFRRLNKNFHQATGKYLFTWENKTFRRLL